MATINHELGRTCKKISFGNREKVSEFENAALGPDADRQRVEHQYARPRERSDALAQLLRHIDHRGQLGLRAFRCSLGTGLDPVHGRNDRRPIGDEHSSYSR
jgi:hypothetical protein